MSSIEDAIGRLEDSAGRLKQLTVEESRAVREAVRDATREATDRVKAEYKDKKAKARQEARDAEKSIKDAQSRIQKALGREAAATTPGTRAPRGMREKQFLEYVAQNPDSKLADIARGIGIQASAANNIAKKAVSDGKVVKSATKTYRMA